MPFVLDTSVTMTWCFEDESDTYGDTVLDRLAADGAQVPAVWPLEVANALAVGERRQRLDAARVARFSELLRALPITVEALRLDRALGSILEMAREYQLSSYDASYLELAAREGLPLATRDARLRAAADRIGVLLLT